MTYEEIGNKIEDKFGKRDPRTKRFGWLTERFEIEFGGEDEGRKKVVEYMEQQYKADGIEDTDFDNILEIIYYEKFSVFIESKADKDRINNHWTANNEEFFKRVNDYRTGVDPNKDREEFDNSKSINDDDHLRYIYELIQNADDCEYGENTPEITFDFSTEGIMKISYNEVGMTYSDIMALTTIGESNKQRNNTKKKIGEKGRGFKTVFTACSKVDIHSGGYHFNLISGTFAPNYIGDEGKYKEGTVIICKVNEAIKDIYCDLKEKYGLGDCENSILNTENIFKNCPVMFANNLTKITVIKSENESFSIEYFKEENEEFCKPSQIICINNGEEIKIESYHYDRDIQFEFDEFCSRYPDKYTNEEFNNLETEIKTYTMSVVIPKETDEIKKGNLYSYLPTSTNINAPFNINIPIKLNKNRSCMYFEEHMTKIIKWNEKILDEIFFGESTFIEAVYDDLKRKENINIFNYIPDFKDDSVNKFLFNGSDDVKKLNNYCSNEKNILDVFKKIKYFKKYNCNEYCNGCDAIILDEFMTDNFLDVLSSHVDGKIKDKYREYFKELSNKEFIIKLTKADIDRVSGLEFENVKLKSDVNVKFINTLLVDSGDEQGYLCGKILEVYNHENKKSYYLPTEKNKLNIYSANNTDGTVRYTCLNRHYWFKNGKYYSDDKICFYAGELDKIDVPVEFVDCDNKKIDILVFEEIYNKIKCEDEFICDKDLFVELMTFMANNITSEELKKVYEDWYEYTKFILKREDKEDLKEYKEIKGELINLINDNIKEYIEA